MASTESVREPYGGAALRAEPAAARPFARRIDCEEHRAPPRGSGRGGALREQGEWERSRRQGERG
jgi:hypothetical protein